MNKEQIIQHSQEIKISPNALILFTRRDILINNRFDYSNYNTTTGEFFKPEKNKIANNQTNGFISPKAQARLKTKIKYLFWLSGCYKLERKKVVLQCSNKISFVTLTLCAEQMHTDQYIKSKLLNQFISELKTRYPSMLYIWRAEKQKNGNIHFHFLINKFIKWEIIRKIWNRILKKEGYLERYQNKFKNLWFEEYLKTIPKFSIDKISKYKIAYNKGVQCNWTNPNSIDVVNIKNVKEIFSYISKYLSKNNAGDKPTCSESPNELAISGRIYYCCSELTAIKPDTHFIDEKIIKDLDLIKSLHPDKIIHEEFFSIIRISIEQAYNIGCFHLYFLFITHTLKLQL